MPRFLRIERLLGADGLARLRAARVVVVGLGATGGYAAEALARAGVGFLRLVDFDRVKPSNVNRQIHALTSTIGRPKVEAMRDRILDINPDASVEALDRFLHRETLDECLAPPLSLAVDAIDSLTPKITLLEACVKRGIPVLSGMGAALRTDPAQLRIGDISEVLACPLGRRVRRGLRRRGVERGILCVHSVEPVDFAYRDPGEEGVDEGPEYERGRPRRTLGSLPTLPAIVGLTLANAALLRLSGHRP